MQELATALDVSTAPCTIAALQASERLWWYQTGPQQRVLQRPRGQAPQVLLIYPLGAM
jgi:hypothetical protein